MKGKIDGGLFEEIVVEEFYSDLNNFELREDLIFEEDFEEEEEESEWLKKVRLRFGCTPDRDGNMSCDNGLVCDKCSFID